MRKADFFGALIWLGFGLSMLFYIIPTHVEKGKWYGLSPYFYPQFISLLIVIFSLLMLANCFLKSKRYEGQSVDLNIHRLIQFSIFLMVVFLGFLLIEKLGVLIGAPLMISAIALLMGERSIFRLCLTATLPVATVYLLVRYVLESALP
tara:strand:- start:5 stop:451 length:447 start_codon:yes stop_codon:yes gene_type:complete